MSLLLVRHAYAGDSSKWVGDDRERPLAGVGWSQASGLVELLAPYELRRIVSSPYLRCVQSVEPLSEARGIPIEHDEALGAERLDEVQGVLQRLEGEDAVVCTHGDLPFLLKKFKKGSVWVFEGGEPAIYLPPPS